MTEETGTSALPWATHADMVRALAKHMPGNQGDLIHAAIGLSGEVGEMISAATRENLLEECGDMEFYLEFAYQAIGTVQPQRSFNEEAVFSLIVTALTVAAAGLLDVAKKSWVYEKPLDRMPAAKLLDHIGNDLSELYHFLGVRVEDVKHRNMAKRYHSGQYSDAQAQARADKQEGA